MAWWPHGIDRAQRAARSAHEPPRSEQGWRRRTRRGTADLGPQGLGKVALCRKCDVPRATCGPTLRAEVAGRKAQTPVRASRTKRSSRDFAETLPGAGGQDRTSRWSLKDRVRLSKIACPFSAVARDGRPITPDSEIGRASCRERV